MMTTLPIPDPSNLQSNLTHLALDKKMVRLSRRLSLRGLVASVVLAATPAGAQQPAAAPTVVAGSEVSLSAITKAEWIKGEGPTSFEPGKVYIFECWATWCGPCIGMIPHVNELHKKYHDKGLRVYGLSVWEDDKDKVATFVTKKGDGMSYPVAFTGNGAAFETEWLKAAGVKAIPHAFIVRNGKLLASTQASRLTEPLIENLLSGDEGAKKAADTILSAQNNQGKADKLVRDFYSARREKDVKKMTALLKELKAIDSGYYEIPSLELSVLMISKQWQAAVTALNEMPASESKRGFVLMTCMQLARNDHYDYPADFMKALVNSYSDHVTHSANPIGPNHFACLSILQWKIGDKQDAVVTADKGVDAAKAYSKGRESYIKPYVRFAKSVNEGIMPKYADLAEWQREAREEAKAAR
ncbi:MAG: TlpA disulfide reductase family protein [Verrucomicrobiota bacterium JB025]|nr:TlpA disulfide reductase family protein [Verrucomicrobiota bacterium JB025]